MENPMISRLKKMQSAAVLAPSNAASYTGVAVKEAGLVAIVAASTLVTWMAGYATPVTTIVAGIMGLIACIAISVKPSLAGFLTPLYAILEGMFLACISAYAETMYPGMVMQAVLLTFGVALAAAFAYAKGIVTVDSRFMKIVGIALVGVVLCMVGKILLSFFGIGFPMLEGGIIGIAIDVAIIGLAAACLCIDYEQIRQAVEQGMPKDYEWVCAFSLLVTLVWLYVRALDLLMTIANSRD